MMYSVRTQDSFFNTFHENETVMQYLILRSTAAEYYRLGHRNLTPHGKGGERTKDMTNKDMAVSIIFLNLNIELINCLASYGTDAEVPENGRNWSDEVYEVWKYMSSVQERKKSAKGSEISSYLNGLSHILPKGVKQLVTYENVRKSPNRTMALTFLVMANYIIIHEAKANANRRAYVGGNTWRNDNQDSTTLSKSDCIKMSRTLNVGSKKPANITALGAIGELAPIEWDGSDEKIYTLSCLCVNNLQPHKYLERNLIEDAVKWVEKCWIGSNNTNAILLHWEPKSGTGGSRQTRQGKGSKDEEVKLDLKLSEISKSLTKLIDVCVKNGSTENTHYGRAVLNHINSLKFGRFKTLLAARRKIAGVYELPKKFKNEELLQVLIILGEESNGKLKPAAASSDNIEQALTHDTYSAQMAEHVDVYLEKKDIMVFEMDGTLYEELYKSIVKEEEIKEAWLKDFMSVVYEIDASDVWMTSFANKECPEEEKVMIVFGKEDAVDAMLTEPYQEPKGEIENAKCNTENEDEDSDNEGFGDYFG